MKVIKLIGNIIVVIAGFAVLYALQRWPLVFVAAAIIWAIVWLVNYSKPENRNKRAEQEKLSAKNKKDLEEKEKEERRLAKDASDKFIANKILLERKVEQRRIAHRDANTQESPYHYEIGNHANESLAIRYGIANREKKVKEYWYHGKGGQKLRNADKDMVYYEPAGTIRLQKIKNIKEAQFEVMLSDFRDRRAIAVIEPGTEYVKTFLPLSGKWFEQNAELEMTLKGNGTFDLKELAQIHVDKAVQPNA